MHVYKMDDGRQIVSSFPNEKLGKPLNEAQAKALFNNREREEEEAKKLEAQSNAQDVEKAVRIREEIAKKLGLTVEEMSFL